VLLGKKYQHDVTVKQIVVLCEAVNKLLNQVDPIINAYFIFRLDSSQLTKWWNIGTRIFFT